jgi:hypothetical protein
MRESGIQNLGLGVFLWTVDHLVREMDCGEIIGKPWRI